MPKVLQVNDDNFEDVVIQASCLTIVNFWAEWCGPSMVISPVLEELADEYEGQIKVTKVNVEHNKKVPSDNGVENIPTLLFYKDGQVVDRVIGALPKHFLVEKIKHFI